MNVLRERIKQQGKDIKINIKIKEEKLHGNGIFMENISDLLYVSLIDLCERRNLEELSNGTLHTNLWNRITEEKPTQNHRWMYEKENMNTF